MESETATCESILTALATEDAAMQQLLASISDEQWHTLKRDDGWTIHDIVGHIADSSYGITRLLSQGLPPGMALDVNARNAERRERLSTLPRSEIEQRVSTGFAAVRDLLATDIDLNAPAVANWTVGQWLSLVPVHVASHRQEIEQLLSGNTVSGGDH